MAAKRPFKLPNYKRYDPSAQGYGNSYQWRQGFRQRMGVDEAREVLKDDSPLSILGLSGKPIWAEIKSAYRKLMRIWHPDLNPERREEATEMSKRLNAAFTILEDRYGK